MILRKERTHHTGSSNLLSRAEHPRPVTQPGQSRLSMLSQPKSNQVDEVIERKANRVIATPFEKTRTFYGQTGKNEHPKAQLSHARTFQLEDPDKMKLVFTGESHMIYDKNLGKYRDPDSPMMRRNREVDHKEHLAKEKHEIHAKAIQETQLVGYDNYNLDTLKNNVNLQKVREAKRLLRRKYANRKNMHMIFSAWDYDRTGSISISNLYTMTKRLGLNLNYDEARVLLASADRNGTATLSLDEFLDLIHNKDDMLNLDINKLSRYHADFHLQKEELDDGNIIQQLEEDAKKGRETKHFNQVNLILKNKLNEIANNFVQTDPFKKGYTTYDCFEQNLRKLGVDEKLVSHDDIKALFDRYKTDDHTIHYKNFIDGLKSFNFFLEDAYKEYEAPEGEPIKKYMSEPVKKDEEKYDIVDVRNLPYSTVYNYLAKKRKVSRLIQKFFPKKEDLQTYFAQTLNMPKDDKTCLMSKKQTQDAILNLFKKFDVKNLTHRDFEGFLSSFIYNKHDYTHMNEVLDGIYDEDEATLIDKINNRQKGPAPHKDVAYNPNELAQESQDGFFFRSDSYLNPEAKQKKIHEILKKIDDRIFVERKPAYDLYKMFDVDRDGFVSRKDFVTKAEEMALIPKEDIPVLVDYLDSQNKGYVNFREFHQKIYTNATQQDENAQPTVFPSVMPSKENFEKTAKFVPNTKKKVEELTNDFRPQSSGALLRPSSRFGSTPAWKNTFYNMQAGITSPMFVSDRERFNCSPQAHVLPSLEEKEKRQRVQSAKLDVIKHNQMNLQRRVEQDTNKVDLLDQNRLKTKVQSLATHEQNARLRNNYM